MKVKVGNCGWSYLDAEKYFDEWKSKFKHKLQAYAKLFDVVEINSTFYRIPKLKTAENWRKLADEINPDFEFTIKCSQIITHKDRFGNRSVQVFNKMKEIARALRSKILLFQSPSSFKPNEENIERVKKFFMKIDRDDFILVWEVRWKDKWKEDIVRKLFKDIEVNQCVDPLRQDCFYTKDIVYYRLHGLGYPMYNYNFSEEELKSVVRKLDSKLPVYVMFNNSNCYENALTLKNRIRSSA